MGSILEVENTDSRDKETFKIVGSTEADILAIPATISNDSAV
jgi:transcription elongation GreA/GreB family factor